MLYITLLKWDRPQDSARGDEFKVKSQMPRLSSMEANRQAIIVLKLHH